MHACMRACPHAVRCGAVRCGECVRDLVHLALLELVAVLRLFERDRARALVLTIHLDVDVRVRPCAADVSRESLDYKDLLDVVLDRDALRYAKDALGATVVLALV